MRMVRVGIWILALMLGLQLGAREVIDIDNGWRFFYQYEGSSDHAQTVNLPHTWSIDALNGKQDYFRGVGNYMKELQIPKSWEGKQIYIRFGGAGTVTDLIVNGRHVGEHRGGYGAFVFDLTPYLRYGVSNSIWAQVSNAPQFDVLPTAGDLNIYGGLYRSVELIVTEQTHIAVDHYASPGVYVQQKSVLPDRAEIETVVRVEGASGQALKVDMSIVTPEGDTVVLQQSECKIPETRYTSVVIPVTMQNPVLWDGVDNPYMYTVRVRLSDASAVYDEVTVPLGLRFFTVDPKSGFMLNGRPYRLKGVNYYEDRDGVGLALQPFHVREDLDLITEMGANAIRAAGYPHNPEFYAECDRRGIIVWSEIPLIGPAFMSDRGYVDSEAFRKNGEMQLYEMIFQQYNHPSVVMWGLFADQNTVSDDPTEFIRSLNAKAMQEDPSRLTVGLSNSDGSINFITDLVVWDHVFGWREGLPSDLRVWINQLQKQWGSLCSGISYGAGASIYQQEDSLYRPDYMGRWHPERWQTYLHEQYFPMVNESPFFWGWFVSNMFDYGAATRTWGEGTGLDDRGLVTFDRKYKKDAFYFYKANWNNSEPMVYIAERRWNERAKPKQNIRVYSNANEVELWANGVSLGKKQGANGIFVWENVELRQGMNTLEARADMCWDQALITIH